MSLASPPPSPALEPWRNFAWLVAGRLFRAVLSISIGAWVARYLGPADYGRLNAAMALAIMLLSLCSLGLDSIVRQQLVRQPEETSAILTTSILLRLTSGLVVYGGFALAATFFAREERALWLVAGTMVLTHAPLGLEFWFQARLKMRSAIIAQNVAFALASLLRVSLIFLEAPLVCFALVIILEGPVNVLWVWRALARETPLRLDWRASLAQTWLRTCWPLLAATVVTAVFARLDQTLVLWLAGPVETGHFVAALRMLEFAAFVPLAVAASLMPSIASSRDRGPAAVAAASRHALNATAGAGWLLAAVLVLGSHGIVTYLFGPAYVGSEIAMRILGAAVLLQGLGAVRAECWVSAGWTQRLLAATVVGACTNTALALWWIPQHGANGAALALVVALAVSHLAMSFWWRDARPFARWQIEALAGSGLWRRRKAANA